MESVKYESPEAQRVSDSRSHRWTGLQLRKALPPSPERAVEDPDFKPLDGIYLRNEPDSPRLGEIEESKEPISYTSMLDTGRFH